MAKYVQMRDVRHVETAKVLAALLRQDFLSQFGADPALYRAASTYQPIGKWLKGGPVKSATWQAKPGSATS